MREEWKEGEKNHFSKSNYLAAFVHCGDITILKQVRDKDEECDFLKYAYRVVSTYFLFATSLIHPFNFKLKSLQSDNTNISLVDVLLSVYNV